MTSVPPSLEGHWVPSLVLYRMFTQQGFCSPSIFLYIDSNEAIVVEGGREQDVLAPSTSSVNARSGDTLGCTLR